MPGPKYLNRLVIYYHPSSSKDPLSDEKKRNGDQIHAMLRRDSINLSRTKVIILLYVYLLVQNMNPYQLFFRFQDRLEIATQIPPDASQS